MRRAALIVLLPLVLMACKHPLAIVGEGDIVDLNNSGFGCTYEQFTGNDTACTENDVTGDYFVNYSAVPKPGWRFVRWDGSCGHTSVAPNCAFAVPSVWVVFWDQEYGEIPIPALTAVFEPNALPVALAGSDQTVNEGTEVTIDISASGDSDGTVVSASLVQISGSTVTLTETTFGSAVTDKRYTFTAPTLTQTEVLGFQLTVTDNDGSQASDDVSVTVNPVNASPTVNIPDDPIVNEMSAVLLNAIASDSDGSISSYSWSQISGVAVSLNNTSGASLSFIAPTTSASSVLVFEVTVTDNESATASDTAQVTVLPVNLPPFANAGADNSVNEQTIVTLDGSGSFDADGNIADYSWTQISGDEVGLSDSSASMPTFMAPITTTAVDLIFRLSVTDNEGAVSGNDDVTITVQPVNALPTAGAGADFTVYEGEGVTLSGTAADSDGTIASTQWEQTAGTAITLLNAETLAASFTAPTAGVITLRLTATDNEGGISNDEVNITVMAGAVTGLQAVTGMNDTGQDFGVNFPAGRNNSCIGETIAEQDCSQGRDASNADASDGHAGFSFTKLDSTGQALAADAQSWSCVRDNNTGLVWEAKKDDGGIHDKDNVYRWGGKTAIANAGGTYYPDWDTLVDGSNAEALCGFINWRVPTVKELESLVSLQKVNLSIDSQFFPNTNPWAYWSSSSNHNFPTTAWQVNFLFGGSYYFYRTNGEHVRLVRSPQ